MLVLGAGGFARELLEVLIQLGIRDDLVFFDDLTRDKPDLLFGKYKVLRSESELSRFFSEENPDFAIAVGDPSARKSLCSLAEGLGGRPKSVVSPLASVGAVENRIGDGSCVLTGAIIESHNEIGKGVLIHVGAFVSHDVTVGSFTEVSPRATLLGKVRVGEECRLGAGCIILPSVSIGDRAVVGAGAVVTADVEPESVVAGVPAKHLPEKC
ncbi:MAG TPA: acetyltransferase [Aridibacter sp.]|nr:acetyltransferase [Aridibacter sp.]